MTKMLKQVTGRKLLVLRDMNKTKVTEGGILLVGEAERYDAGEVLQVGGKCLEVRVGQKIWYGNGKGHKIDIEDETVKVVAEYDTIVIIRDDGPPLAVGNRVLVKLMPRPKVSDIIIAPDEFRQAFDTAEIISVGQDVSDPDLLKVGNKIIFNFGQGSPITWKDEQYKLVAEDIILLVIEK